MILEHLSQARGKTPNSLAEEAQLEVSETACLGLSPGTLGRGGGENLTRKETRIIVEPAGWELRECVREGEAGTEGGREGGKE